MNIDLTTIMAFETQNNLKPLIGTDKQKRWAREIRYNLYAAIKDYKPPTNEDWSIRLMDQIKTTILNTDSSPDWIAIHDKGVPTALAKELRRHYARLLETQYAGASAALGLPLMPPSTAKSAGGPSRADDGPAGDRLAALAPAMLALLKKIDDSQDLRGDWNEIGEIVAKAEGKVGDAQHRQEGAPLYYR